VTLVAGLSIGGGPAFVGDLLVSWGVPTKLRLPTRPQEEIHKGLDGSFAAGLAQKLIIIRPYLMIAWAGSVSVIGKLVNELDRVLPACCEEFKKDTDQLLGALDVLPNTVEVVALVFDGDYTYPICVHTRGFELDNQRFYLLGTGRQTFFEFAIQSTSVMPDIETPDGLAARATMMRFAGNAIMSQYASKVGFSESWGGGFEVAHVTEEGFTKVDNVLVRCWSMGPGGELGNIGTSFLMHYQGAALKVTSFGNRDRTTVVKSLVKNSPEVPWRSEVIPEWTVDLFFRVEDKAHICAVQHEFPWSKHHAEFYFDGDNLVGWKMDKSRVDAIIEKIRDKKATTRDQFAIMTL
jgi:hypothetical protein